MDCRDCDDELEHCHHTLVLHFDGVEQCLDPDCLAARDVHVWIASCAELQWPCLCQRVGHSQPLAA